jgi:polar amino acid transport system substrate-binding protein
MLKFLLLTSIFIFFSFSANAERIKVYFYYDQAPFVINEQKKNGFHYEAITLFNSSQSKFQFTSELLPRIRINHLLDDWINKKCPGKNNGCENNWMVLWIAPKFIAGESAEKNFLWVPFCQDKNILLFSANKKISLKNPKSLEGKTYATVLGRNPPEPFLSLINSGKLKREDGSNQEFILHRVISGHADIGVVPLSTLNYLINKETEYKKLKSKFKWETVETFTREAMIPINRPDIQDTLRIISKSNEWKKLMQKYDFKVEGI